MVICDLLSKLIITSEDERWTESELIGACSMLLFAGHEISSGQHLWLGILAADHDPAVFVQSERMDIRRKPNPHLAFGAVIRASQTHRSRNRT